MVVTKGAVTDDPEFDEALADAAEAEKEVQELEQAAALEAEAESKLLLSNTLSAKGAWPLNRQIPSTWMYFVDTVGIC